MTHFQTKILLPIFLIIAVFSVYGQVHHHELISFFDDKDYITKNRYVQAGLSIENIKWAFTTRYHSHWHPVTWLSHMADVQFFGNDPGRHHLVSLFFHILNTLLVFFLFVRLTNEPVKSGVLAALFALHPIHVEPVVMVSFRKDLLCAFFGLLCMHAYVNYAQKGGWLRYTLVFFLFVFGLMSKTVIIALPVLLLLMDFWPLCRISSANQQMSQSNGEHSVQPSVIPKNLRKLIFEKCLLLAPMIFFAIIAVIAREPTRFFPTTHHLANGLVAYILYIRNTVWPTGLSVIYPSLNMVSVWQVLGAMCVLFIVTFAVWRQRASRPYLLAGWSWFLLSLLPVLGILGFMGPHTIADRYVYVPVMGLFIIAVWGGADILGTWQPWQKVMPVITGSLLFSVMALSWIYVGFWKNDVLLFTHAVRVTSGNFKAHNNLGMALMEKGEDQAAEAQFRIALKIKQDFPNAHGNLGVLLGRQGRLEEAEYYFLEVLRIAPDNAAWHNNLGLVLKDMGRLDDALIFFRHAVSISPEEAPMQYNLGNALLIKGDLEQAIAHLSKAIDIDSELAEAHNALGYALTLSGNPPKAIFHFKVALKIDPYYEEARENLDGVEEMVGR